MRLKWWKGALLLVFLFFGLFACRSKRKGREVVAKNRKMGVVVESIRAQRRLRVQRPFFENVGS
jgi:hypothetical protein